MRRLARGSARGSDLVLLLVLSACARSPRTALIGYAVAGNGAQAGGLAEQLADSSRPAGSPVIRVSTGDSAVSSQPSGALMGEVDKAIRLAADPRIVAVVGPGGSREALQTAPIYSQAGLPNLVPTSTSRLLHRAGPWTFMLAADDSIQGEFIGAFVAERLHARSALMFYIPDEYGMGLATGIASAFAQRGIQLVDRIPVRTRQSCPPQAVGNAYDDAVAEAFRGRSAETVVIAGRTIEVACLAQAIYARGMRTSFVAGDGTLVDQQFLEMAGAAADSIYLTAFWHPSQPASLSREFVARFLRFAGRTPRHDDAMFYDATALIAEAIRSVGPDRAAIRGYLEQLGRTRPPYLGVTGPIAFTPQAPRPLLMTRIRGGRTERVPSP